MLFKIKQKSNKNEEYIWVKKDHAIRGFCTKSYTK